MSDQINCGEVNVQDLYRIVIPKNIRERYNINPGDSVEVFIKLVERDSNVQCNI